MRTTSIVAAAIAISSPVSASTSTSSTSARVVAVELQGVRGFFVPSPIFRELDADAEELRIRRREIDALRTESDRLRLALAHRTETTSAALAVRDLYRDALRDRSAATSVTDSRELWTGLGFVLGVLATIAIAAAVPAR